GAGNILVNPIAQIQFNALTNRNNTTQTVEVRSNFAGLGVFRLATDADPASFNLRSGSSGGSTAQNSGSGVLAIDAVISQNLNQATFGDGTWFFGSTNDGTGASNGATNALNGTYNGITLGAGAGNLYRLGAGGQTLYIGNAAAATANNNVL